MNLIKENSTKEDINQWYLTYLAYNKDWNSLVELLKNNTLKSYHLCIANLLEKQFVLDALDEIAGKKNTSLLVESLPKPGTEFAKRISYLFQMEYDSYENIYMKLSENSKSIDAEICFQ